MTNLNKTLLMIAAASVLVLLATFLGGNAYLEHQVRQVIPAFVKQAERENLELTEFSFQDASISSSRSLTWQYIRSKARVLNNDAFDTATRYTLSIGQLRLFSKDHRYEDLVIDAQEISLSTRDRQTGDLGSSLSVTDQLTNVSLYGRMFSTEFRSSTANPGEGLKRRLEELGKFFVDGYLTIPAEFSGDVQIRLGNRPIKLPVSLAEDAGRWKLVLASDALEQIVGAMSLTISEAESALFAANPIRAGIWAQTRFYIDQKVKELPPKQGREEVPIETYRHVLLGYYLSQALGTQFFERYMEAYLSGGGTIKSPKELQSEKENLLLGRRYAEQKIEFAKLAELSIKEGSVATKKENWSIR